MLFSRFVCGLVLVLRCVITCAEGRETYVTLVTNDDYVVGAQVLAASLGECKTQKPLLALISQQVGAEGREILAKMGFELREVGRPHVGEGDGHR